MIRGWIIVFITGLLLWAAWWFLVNMNSITITVKMKKHIIDEDKQRELDILKDMQLSYNQRVVNTKQGFRLAAWTCPYCKGINETVIPPARLVHPEKGYWDSLTSCYECGELSFIYKFADGTMEVKPIEEPKDNREGVIC